MHALASLLSVVKSTLSIPTLLARGASQSMKGGAWGELRWVLGKQ